MEDKNKKYLDKILKWFVDDTIINHETGIIIYPFSPTGPTGKLLPNFMNNLESYLSWEMYSNLLATCKDTYGLNYDETKYIWDNYRKIIRDKCNKEYLNESEDKKEIYLNKVLQWLLDDTTIIGNKVKFPFLENGISYSIRNIKVTKDPFYTIYNDIGRHDFQFIDYCRNNYGLIYSEIEGLFNQYKKIISRRLLGR